jgi:hypothetical protein
VNGFKISLFVWAQEEYTKYANRSPQPHLPDISLLNAPADRYLGQKYEGPWPIYIKRVIDNKAYEVEPDVSTDGPRTDWTKSTDWWTVHGQDGLKQVFI